MSPAQVNLKNERQVWLRLDKDNLLTHLLTISKDTKCWTSYENL